MEEPGVDINEQLRIVQGEVPHDCSEPSPLMVATLLFEEGRELAHDKVLRYIVDRGVDTGVSINCGHRTVPFHDLSSPENMQIAGVASAFVSSGEIYDHKHGDRMAQWGILLLGGDKEARWFWSEVWLPGYTRPSCIELTVEGLATLMTESERGKAILNPLATYVGFVRLLEHKMDFQQRVRDNIGYQFCRSAAQLERMRDMIGLAHKVD